MVGFWPDPLFSSTFSLCSLDTAVQESRSSRVEKPTAISQTLTVTLCRCLPLNSSTPRLLNFSTPSVCDVPKGQVRAPDTI